MIAQENAINEGLHKPQPARNVKLNIQNYKLTKPMK